MHRGLYINQASVGGAKYKPCEISRIFPGSGCLTRFLLVQYITIELAAVFVSLQSYHFTFNLKSRILFIFNIMEMSFT